MTKLEKVSMAALFFGFGVAFGWGTWGQKPQVIEVQLPSASVQVQPSVSPSPIVVSPLPSATPSVVLPATPSPVVSPSPTDGLTDNERRILVKAEQNLLEVKRVAPNTSFQSIADSNWLPSAKLWSFFVKTSEMSGSAEEMVGQHGQIWGDRLKLVDYKPSKAVNKEMLRFLKEGTVLSDTW